MPGLIWNVGNKRGVIHDAGRIWKEMSKLPDICTALILRSVSRAEYKVSLADDVEGADLIISHAGAGSVMESLRNVSAMDNRLQLLYSPLSPFSLFVVRPST